MNNNEEKTLVSWIYMNIDEEKTPLLINLSNNNSYNNIDNHTAIWRDICTYILQCFGVALLIITVLTNNPNMSATSLLAFSTCFISSLILLLFIQYQINNYYSKQSLYGVPILFFLGLCCKMCVLAADLSVFLILRSLKVELGNPHPKHPLTMFELIIRIIITVFCLMGVLEELLKFHFIRSALSWSLIQPRVYASEKWGIILISIAVSLGASSFNVVKYIYISDTLLPWYYNIPAALMEVGLNTATGIIVGAKMTQIYREPKRKKTIIWNIIAPATFFRSLFFIVQMLPLRYRSDMEEELEASHFYHHITKVMYFHHHHFPSYNIGHIGYILLYVFNFALIIIAFAVGANRFKLIPNNNEN